MNRKITLPELVEALTVVTNTTKRVSETFLRELFALISEQLITGESVKIKGLGVFKVVKVDARRSVDVNTGEEIVIASHNKVSFTADKELAEAVNMPFASFETVVLSDDIPEQEMKRIEAEGDIEDDTVAEVAVESLPETEEIAEVVAEDVVPVEAVEDVIKTEPVVEPEAIDGEVTEPEAEVVTETIVEGVVEDVIIEPEVVEDDTVNNDVVYTKSLVKIADENGLNNYEVVAKVGKRKFISGYMWGFISAALFASIVFIIINFDINITPKVEEVLVEEVATDVTTPVLVVAELADTIISKPNVVDKDKIVEKPKVTTKPKVVYDTITRTRFMATMAREHYGNMNFWVYIYEENKAKIANPSVIAPGTVLVIPSAEKYGINANDPESVRTAEIKSKAFNARYK